MTTVHSICPAAICVIAETRVCQTSRTCRFSPAPYSSQRKFVPASRFCLRKSFVDFSFYLYFYLLRRLHFSFDFVAVIRRQKTSVSWKPTSAAGQFGFISCYFYSGFPAWRFPTFVGEPLLPRIRRKYQKISAYRSSQLPPPNGTQTYEKYPCRIIEPAVVSNRVTTKRIGFTPRYSLTQQGHIRSPKNISYQPQKTLA